MTTILQLKNSLFGDNGHSSRLVDQFVAEWRRRAPDTRVHRRDLGESAVPHLSAARFSAAAIAPDDRTPQQADEAAIADALVEELVSADILVLGVPMYNFNIPSTLKAWFDHVARAGTTFRYTDTGPEGLLKGKKAYVFVASGGVYESTELDFVGPYLRHMLGFLGIEDVSFARAEGLAMGEETTREALAAANARVMELAA